MHRSVEERQAFCAVAAERMKLAPTLAEAKIWPWLKEMGFERQHVVSGQTKNGGLWWYILDYYHEEARLAVEVDGGVHARQRGRDRRRDTRLAQDGIETVRVANRDVLKYFDLAQEAVMAAYRRR